MHHTEVSPGKGSIIWLLSDENGKPRKINAITDIDENGFIDRFHAVYKREIPLVEQLQHIEKGDNFTIDFSLYNEQLNYKPREVYNNMRKQEEVAGLSAGFVKFLLFAGGLAAAWFAYAATSDVAQMSLKLIQ